MNTVIYRASGRWGREFVGELDNAGLVYRGEQRHYDIVGEVDSDGLVYRGDRNRNDVVGEVDSDGRVYRGDPSRYDVVGEVGSDGRVYRGDPSRYDVVGEVNGPNSGAGAAALLLLLADGEVGDLKASVKNEVRTTGGAVLTALALEAAGHYFSGAARRERRIDRAFRPLRRALAELEVADEALTASRPDDAVKAARATRTHLDDAAASHPQDADVTEAARLLRCTTVLMELRCGSNSADEHRLHLEQELHALKDSFLGQSAREIEFELAKTVRDFEWAAELIAALEADYPDDARYGEERRALDQFLAQAADLAAMQEALSATSRLIDLSANLDDALDRGGELIRDAEQAIEIATRDPSAETPPTLRALATELEANIEVTESITNSCRESLAELVELDAGAPDDARKLVEDTRNVTASMVETAERRLEVAGRSRDILLETTHVIEDSDFFVGILAREAIQGLQSTDEKETRERVQELIEASQQQASDGDAAEAARSLKVAMGLNRTVIESAEKRGEHIRAALEPGRLPDEQRSVLEQALELTDQSATRARQFAEQLPPFIDSLETADQRDPP